MPRLISEPARIPVHCEKAGRDGAEYVAVCLPGFGPDTVNREA